MTAVPTRSPRFSRNGSRLPALGYRLTEGTLACLEVGLILALAAPLVGLFGWIPIFAGPPFGVGMFAAGVILTLMILPTIIAISRDVISATPDNQREAMLALGATRWETITRAVLPYARSGIFGAVIL